MSKGNLRYLQMIHKKRTIALEGALNVRELGGLPLKDGRKVRSGKLIRAGRLSNLTNTDCSVLTNLWNVTTIVDLRNDQEISEHPDIIPEDAVFKKISLISGEKKGISREDFGMTMSGLAIVRAKELMMDGGAGALLKGMYGQMAENAACIEKLRQFFQTLLEQEEGSFLFHCTSGKDRTGVTAALILYVLGADMETIKSDYLYTNEQNHDYRENLLNRMRNRGAEEELIEEIRILESVDPSYIEQFFSTITEKYGSIDLFLKEEIGITNIKREQLLDRYTERQ